MVKKFLAIVGVGRSGTSLLMSMLNTHPEIAFVPETHFVGRYIVDHPLLNAKDLKERLVDDHRFHRLAISQDTVENIIASLEDQFSIAEFYKSILNFYTTKSKTQIIGDKAPKNIEYLPIIKHLFPEAYLIHIIRDPRDVYLSRTKAKWSSDYSDLAHFTAYRSQYNLGCHYGPKLFANHYYEIHYEDLISNPDSELASICNWLGVPFDDRMLEFSNSARELMAPEEEAWKSETLKPLMMGNKNKWRAELPQEKNWVIEAACSPAFSGGYYQRSPKPNNLHIKMKHFVISGFNFGTEVLFRSWVRLKNWRAIAGNSFVIRRNQ